MPVGAFNACLAVPSPWRLDLCDFVRAFISVLLFYYILLFILLQLFCARKTGNLKKIKTLSTPHYG
jgi:hypothetical protein